MSFDLSYLLYGSLFVGALLLIEGAYYFLLDARGGSRRQINRRLRMLASGASSRESLEKLRRQPTGPVSLVRLIPRLERLLARAGVTMSTGRLVGIMVALWGAGFVAAQVLANPGLLPSLMVATACGVGLPLLYLARRGGRRLKRFGEQLPDALDLVVRSLRAGHPVNSAMALVANEMPDPIGSEFGIAVDEITYGLDLRQALENMSARVEHPDLRYVIVTIKIQHGTGGNLAEVLGNTSKVIRDRFQMYRKIRALSAEGKLSARILSALPFVVIGALLLISPEYYRDAQGDPLFPVLLTIGLAIMATGIFTMWRIVQIRV